ncbi:MAG: hypothetical protein ACRC5W_05695 [Cetobacterium sp.]|uniref:hypothetical protein n=1 Tax=Cetobacterium sp. TaxID=2071632 RepID=UPI003F3FD744
MYYREYFYYLKERLPKKCYEVLQECFEKNKNEVENCFNLLQNSSNKIEVSDILLPIKEKYYSMDYEILLREELITNHNCLKDNSYKLDRFGIYLLHYLNN